LPIFLEILSRMLVLSKPIFTFIILALDGTQVQICHESVVHVLLLFSTRGQSKPRSFLSILWQYCPERHRRMPRKSSLSSQAFIWVPDARVVPDALATVTSLLSSIAEFCLDPSKVTQAPMSHL
jgi:hypothetical protein